ncbi:glycine cleavage system aminomethyltransferase GcvT [Advenella sp. RU8]|uniref:glycine cleavage system aminomethyltransferase GcvT n=1 Tax=Advenella sp. RU8 TaxID=3399575 RepID=UPI003AAF3674
MSSEHLQFTPLHDTHLSLGAKMVDFGGWDMPVSYGSQIEEHHAVRNAVGMFDVSHMLNIDISGQGSLGFLRRVLANDVARLAVPGKALYSCMLNPEGGVIDDLIVYFFAPNNWRLVVNAGRAKVDVAWLHEQAGQGDYGQVQITPRHDLAMVAVQGPHAREKVWNIRSGLQAQTESLSPFTAVFIESDFMVARTGYTGEDGFEIVLPATQVVDLWNALLAQGVRPCGLGARDTLRLEAGMNLYGQDMDEAIQPAQAGLAWTISLKDEARDFIGRKAITQAPKRNAFMGIRLNERGVMRAHMKVRTELGDGEITSGTMSPTLGFSIGFARLPEGIQPGASVKVELRGKWLPATLCTLPFVRNGKPLVS